MISKINTHKGAAGALKYDIEKQGAQILFKGNIYSEEHAGMAAEMLAVSDQRALKSNTFHISLSLGDERATEEQWLNVAETYLKSLGFDLEKTQYVVTRHKDTEHDHIHITANRVMLDGSLVSDSNVRYRSHIATRESEKAAGLKIFTKETEQTKSGKMNDLRTSIKSAISKSLDYNGFKSNLKDAGIEIIENKSKTTSFISGISYKTTTTGQVWKGSAIGKDYSYAAITKALDYALESPETALTYSGSSPIRSGCISVGGGSTNLGKNLMRGREGLGLTAGQKDRIRKESSHEL